MAVDIGQRQAPFGAGDTRVLAAQHGLVATVATKRQLAHVQRRAQLQQFVRGAAQLVRLGAAVGTRFGVAQRQHAAAQRQVAAQVSADYAAVVTLWVALRVTLRALAGQRLVAFQQQAALQTAVAALAGPVAATQVNIQQRGQQPLVATPRGAARIEVDSVGPVSSGTHTEHHAALEPREGKLAQPLQLGAAVIHRGGVSSVGAAERLHRQLALQCQAVAAHEEVFEAADQFFLRGLPERQRSVLVPTQRVGARGAGAVGREAAVRDDGRQPGTRVQRAQRRVAAAGVQQRRLGRVGRIGRACTVQRHRQPLQHHRLRQSVQRVALRRDRHAHQ